MSSLIVEVCRIDSVEKHPNADRLSIAKVKGWNCIIQLDQYKVGDLVVFIPPDCVLPDSLVEEYNLTYLRGNNRTRTVKLRGYLSEGLILPITNKAWGIGDNVADKLCIKKYEEPQRFNARFAPQLIVSKKKLNPFFDKYTDVENIKNFPDVFQIGDEVVITEKIHGCLNKNTKITLSDNSKLTIGVIVDNKLDVELLGMDRYGHVVPTKITNWFNNDITDEWIKITYNRRGFGTQGNYFGAVICTPNHQIYTDNGYVDADKLLIGDSVYNLKKTKSLSYLAKSVLTGLMLGDGCLNIAIDTASISFSHIKSQQRYLDYTLQCLGDIAGNQQKSVVSGYGSEMVRARSISSHDILTEFGTWISPLSNDKQIPEDILLNPISLAFWYMDDGSLTHSDSQEDRVLFATNGFNEQSVDILVRKLKDNFDINAIKYFSNGFRIRLNANDANKLFLLISPYICDSMQYKLPDKFKNRNMKLDDNEISSLNNLIVKQHIIKIEKFVSTKRNRHRYDIETDTHNFFANDILVHNSNARFARLPIYCSSEMPLMERIKCFISKNLLGKKYEFVYGSHNVQLYSATKTKTFYGTNIWEKIARREGLEETLTDDMIVYAEIYGNGVQDLTYGLTDNIDYAVFDIKYNGKYLDWMYLEDLCHMIDLPLVPVLYIGKLEEDTIAKYTVGQSVLYPSQIREGCVIKSYYETNHPRIGRKILKSVNPEYLTRKNGTEHH